MPTGYQIFKTEIYKTIKDKYFSDYKLKEGEHIISLISKKCKEKWLSLNSKEQSAYNHKSKEKKLGKNDSPPPYEYENKTETIDNDYIDVTEWNYKGTKFLVDIVTNELYNFNTQDPVGMIRHSIANGKGWKIIDKNDSIITEYTQWDHKGMSYLVDEKTNELYHFDTQDHMGKIRKKNEKNGYTIEEMSKEKVEIAIEYVTPTVNEPKKKHKRKYIPKAVKESVWKKYISETELKGKCFVGCGTDIQINTFEVGHVLAVSNGGKNEIENLRPICSLCNKSMGSTNIEDFIKTFGFKQETDDFDQELKNITKNIGVIDKYIKNDIKNLDTLKDKQQTLSQEINIFEELIQKTKIQLESKKKQLTKHETKMNKFENDILSKNKEKKLLEIKKMQRRMIIFNSKIIENREVFIHNQIMEEEKLKDEIRIELILEQKKINLKKQVMKEMGFTD